MQRLNCRNKGNVKLLKAAIFDVDGTVLDSMPMWATLGQNYLKSKGLNPSEDIDEKMLSFTVPQAAQYMKEQYKLALPAETIEAEVQQLTEDFYKNKVQIKDGIKDTLDFLQAKNIPMIVASSSVKELIEGAFKRLDLMKYFKSIFIGSKSTPELFEQCLSYLKARPEEVLLFEDGMHSIVTAKKTGIKTVLIKDIQTNYEEIKKLSAFIFEDNEWKQF
ncbi:MAG: HAD family phosphatase [Treponema sp.]|nr:HAD family phosphatase [Spirochaetales bacterium]MDY5812691.1 HAD family phosphatase [Treponema sp.]